MAPLLIQVLQPLPRPLRQAAGRPLQLGRVCRVAAVRWLLAPLLAVLVGLSCGPGAAAAADGSDGARLFEAHCAGCHVNGGNIIRRGKTLRLAALERQGLASPEAIAAIAAAGVGQMSGYGEQLGEAGVQAVAEWVWQQAQADWPRG